MRLTTTGRSSATAMCSGPVSGASTSDDPSRMPTRLRSPLPSAERRCTRARENHLLGRAARAVSVRRRAPAADRNRSQSASATSAHRSGSQSFCGLLVATTIDASGRSNGAKKTRCCARAFVVPRPEVPHDFADRHAERREKLEVLILDVLRRVRRNSLRREQPIHVARARAIEAELHGRVGERRDDARLEVHLQIDHQSNRASPAPAACRRTRAAAGAIEDDDVVDGPVAADEGHRPGLQNPCDVRARARAASAR